MSAPSEMTRWLEARSPAPPPALAVRLRTLLAAGEQRSSGDAADVMLDRAIALLRDLLKGGGLHRESALDLLAADALVTYAFEAAADQPAALEVRARDGMRRIAAVVGAS